MNIIARGRKTSRTTELIERAARAGDEGKVCYIVCRSHEEASRIFRKAREMGRDVRLPITHEDFLLRKYSGVHIHHFLFDNADLFIQSLTPVTVDTIVVCDESKRSY